MIAAISQIQKLRSMIPDLIEASGYRNDFIAKKLKMRPQYFSVKKQRGNWSEKELSLIIETLTQPSSVVEDMLMLEEMILIEGEKSVSYADFKKEVNTWK